MYKQIERDIRHKIQQGEWPTGSMLPGRANLAKIYGVSIPTLEQAIGILIADGTLRAESKRGTFVSQTLPLSTPFPPPSLPLLPTGAFPYMSPEKPRPTLGIIAQAPHIDLAEEKTQPQIGLDPGQWTYFLMQSLQQQFTQAGGQVRLIQEIGYTSERTTMKEAITLLLDHGIDAIVISIFDVRSISQTVQALLDLKHVPVVLVSWEAIVSPCSSVCIDDVEAGYRAALHLLRVGHAPLLFLQIDDRSWVDKRIEGARQALQDFGVAPDQLLIRSEMKTTEGDDTETLAYQASQKWIAQGILTSEQQTRPIGIIAQNDFTAAGFLRAAQVAGKVVGKDFGLIGFDDHPLATELGITSIRPPIEELGEEVIRILWRQMHERSISQQRILLSGRLIVRASTSRGRKSEPEQIQRPLQGQ
ncbi:hypothetical protein KDA_51610 [Dictyobacter alpinus]|uniref:HTH gntR-type domain-containing protein n=2 Tax=Dictyobacter alpinus TaxID=2014873 RepID=A0A402BEJ0_9CHLR|nr:hypothetical protein KDA_51610 [Dictyobacter alpinus]